MCVISYVPEGKTLNDETLDKMWKRNGDGAGFVARKAGENVWTFKKGIMTLEKLKEELAPFREEGAEFVLHLRIKSRGDINPEMTHPFEFSRNGGEKRFIFHNGTVKLFAGTGGCSDSSSLAKLLRPIDNSATKKILAHLSKENHGRFVTFCQKGDAKPVIEIYPDSESEWKDGIWFSNTKHEEELRTVVYEVNHHRQNVGVQNRPTQPLIDEIVKFYLKKANKPDTAQNRTTIVEHYSMFIMCEDFLKKILDKIDKNQHNGDPILEFFEI